MTRGLTGTGLLVLVLVAAACSGTPASTDSEFPPWLESLVASTTDFQKEILSDGEVTIDELEKAALATVQCLEENGVVVSDFSFDSENAEWGMSIVLGAEVPDDAEMNSLDAIQAECEGEFLIVVWNVFGFQNQPTPEELSLELARAAQCLREKGFEVPEGATREVMQNFAGSSRRAYGECRQLAQEQGN
ncbi:hypothetical protein MNBD_ACTINO02-3067 [hydrothermal vent metagenome]|uniref:Lipoprotein n=1 Tax=hydrothermal vent metagenome TaxID=652676 RepID=A0A3B0T1A2_9ZZZZ